MFLLIYGDKPFSFIFPHEFMYTFPSVGSLELFKSVGRLIIRKYYGSKDSVMTNDVMTRDIIRTNIYTNKLKL